MILGVILVLIGLVAWAALVYDNRHSIKHDRFGETMTDVFAC